MSCFDAMVLTFHGGRCCGIKTIWGLDRKPDLTVPALEEVPEDNRDKKGGNPDGSDTRFFHLAAPKESRKSRLYRYLWYVDRRRPKGLVEIVLKDAPGDTWDQVRDWGPVLEEVGFKKVVTFRNSNSGQDVTVFHRISGLPDTPKIVPPSDIDVPTQKPFVDILGERDEDDDGIGEDCEDDCEDDLDFD